MKKSGRLLYEPPRARDLSASSVSGMIPLGICENGSNPIAATCYNGTIPIQSDVCSPVGTLPLRGRCDSGGNAAEGCSLGSSVDDCVAGLTF